MRKLWLVLFCGVCTVLQADEVRIWAEATINNQPVRLAFDTGAPDLWLFRRTAERLKLKLVHFPPEVHPPADTVSTGEKTEPVELSLASAKDRTEFFIMNDPPKQASTEVEGLLSWYVDGRTATVYARLADDPTRAYPHNHLGALFMPRDLQTRQSDPLVAHVAPNSPASSANICDGDVLLKIDDNSPRRASNDVEQVVEPAGSGDFPVARPPRARQQPTGNWTVPRTRRLESLRYGPV